MFSRSTREGPDRFPGRVNDALDDLELIIPTTDGEGLYERDIFY